MKKVFAVIIIAIIGYIYLNQQEHNQNLTTARKNNLTYKESLVPVIKTPRLKKQVIKLTTKKIAKSPTKSIPLKIEKERNSFIPTDPNGNLYVSYIKVLQDQKLIIAHGDIIIGDYDDYEKYINGEKALTIASPKLWKKGRIPYELTEQEGHLFDVTTKTIAYFNENTKLTFVAREFEDEDYIRFETGNENCYSRLGRQGGAQIISLSNACTMQKIAHEILHSLGFLHEQNREDRDDYITIIWDNIEPTQHLQFKKISNSLMPTSQTKFNFNSIMLYPANAFSIVDNDFSIVTVNGEGYQTTSDVLNEIDLKRIELLYKNELNP